MSDSAANDLITGLATGGMQLAGASPALVEAARRLLPVVLSYAERAIERGADPEAELGLMMAAAEEAARQAERAKFGGG